MERRNDYVYFKDRAACELALAKKSEDQAERNIHLMSAECYYNLAHALAEREQIRANVAPPRAVTLKATEVDSLPPRGE